MKQLINFKGLNCYNNSIITIANEYQINFVQSFYNLWSETDFDCNNALNFYSSKRLFDNLAKLGVKVETIEKKDNEFFISTINNLKPNELFVIGMDSFYIPWNDIYQNRHDYHYFILQNSDDSDLLCFDPTYNIDNEKLSKREIFENAFEICRLTIKKNTENLTFDLKEELSLIKASDEKLKKILFEKIEYANATDIRIHHQTAKYIDALINNRLMFKYYLKTLNLSKENYQNFMPENYFMTWVAIKNGLNKLSLSKDDKLSKQISDLIIKLLTKDSDYSQKLEL